MMMNEHAEFVYEPAFDPEDGRARAYASLAAIDMARLRRDESKVPPTKYGSERRCRNCGTPFLPRKHDHAFCCTECQRSWWEGKKRKERLAEGPTRCRECGAEFDPPTPNTKYCSDWCRRQAKRRRAREARAREARTR